MPDAVELGAVFAYLAARRDEQLARLFDYLRRPSISAHGLGIVEVADYARDLLERAGLSARVIPTGGGPMVLGERIERPDRPTVLIYGHYDVQPPDPLDRWISSPFEPTIRDGRIYARGVG